MGTQRISKRAKNPKQNRTSKPTSKDTNGNLWRTMLVVKGQNKNLDVILQHNDDEEEGKKKEQIRWILSSLKSFVTLLLQNSEKIYSKCVWEQKIPPQFNVPNSNFCFLKYLYWSLKVLLCIYLKDNLF